MPWPQITRRERRLQVRNDIAQHLPGADASVPNNPLRVMGDAMASLTHDNDAHLDWVARMMMPDTAEGEFVDRWANIWLPGGRKPATFAAGQITVEGASGSIVPTGAELTVTVFGDDGAALIVPFVVTAGVTLAGPSAVVPVLATVAGAAGNIEEGGALAWVSVPAGLDGTAAVAAPGLAGGAEAESDADLIERYVNRIQQPPHGGNRNDYVQWALEVPGVTRAWAAKEMGPGTVTVRFMMDDLRANGIPLAGDLAAVVAALDAVRPVTAADLYVPAPIALPLNLTITNLDNDTPEVRANIALEIAEMLKARAAPGATIYASWVREAISAATGEDRHDITVGNTTCPTAGHIVVPGVITYA